MRWCLTLLAVLALASPARAQNCTASFDPGSGNNGQGVGGRPPSVSLHNCASQGDVTNIFNSTNSISNQLVTFEQQSAITNQTFNNRFTAIQNQINVNNLNAQRGIAMAMAAGSLGISGGASGAGAGKIAAALGFGEFAGQTSLSAGISYAVTKKLTFGAGVSVAPITGSPMVGTFGSMTWIIN